MGNCLLLREWDSLLRDTWLIDDKNLLHLSKEDSSQKVTRWMMEVREFHCFVEKIPGLQTLSQGQEQLKFGPHQLAPTAALISLQLGDRGCFWLH